MEIPARFEAVPLARFAFQAVCLATNPFAAIRKPTCATCSANPLILAGEASSSRMQFDHLVAKAGLADGVNVWPHRNNLALFLNYVAIGMGVALITRPAPGSHPDPPELEQQLVFRDLSHILGHEQVVLLHPRGRHELSHVRAFRERVVAELGVAKGGTKEWGQGNPEFIPLSHSRVRSHGACHFPGHSAANSSRRSDGSLSVELSQKMRPSQA